MHNAGVQARLIAQQHHGELFPLPEPSVDEELEAGAPRYAKQRRAQRMDAAARQASMVAGATPRRVGCRGACGAEGGERADDAAAGHAKSLANSVLS